MVAVGVAVVVVVGVAVGVAVAVVVAVGVVVVVGVVVGVVVAVVVAVAVVVVVGVEVVKLMSSESIVVSFAGDSFTVSTETETKGLPLTFAEFCSLLDQFVGGRPVYFRPVSAQPAPGKIDWVKEAAFHFGVSESLIRTYERTEPADCKECGRAFEGPGLCPQCADDKSGFSK